MFKKIIGILSISIILSGCTSGNLVVKGEENEEDDIVEETISYQGSLIENREQDFEKGEMENIELNENGEIELETDKEEGIYTSPIISTDSFNELVASWNVNTPDETYIELSIQAKIEDEWTMWYSYGKWSSKGNGGSVRDQSDKFGKMSIDTLEILWGNYADALRYKIRLNREDNTVETPSIRSIYMSLKTDQEDTSVFAEDIDYLIELDVPERSQMIVPEIGNRICSPTSLSMVLEYYGHDMETEEVAAAVIDNEVDIYGNWSYNASFAGSKGLNAYVARFHSVDEIKKKISEGIPVIASIKTKSENTLVGAPQTYPSGHLIVVRGFAEKDGEEYVIVNDPASPEVENVRREYKLSGFETAWSNMVYIVSEDKE